jgi:hypothetical protein
MPRIRIYPPGQDEPPPTGSGALLLIHQNPLVSVYAFDIPTDPPTKFRITSYPKRDDTGIALYFERDSTGAAIPYYSCSVFHEDTTADSEGGLNKVRITVQNITREAIALAENYNGLIGQKVRHVIVKYDELPDASALRYEEVFEVLEPTFTESSAVLTCGRTALAQAKFPGRRISRTHCQHKYGSVGCGYDTTRSGALQTCDFTLDGANGCYVHGDDEEDAGLENRHDRLGRVRALVFPGVARSTGVETA